MTSRERIPPSILFVVATAFGVSSTIQAYWLQRLANDAVPHTALVLLVMNLAYWYVPALAAPLIMALASRYRWGSVPWYRQVLIHLPFALAFALLHSLAMRLTRAAIMPAWMLPSAVFDTRAILKETLVQLDWLLMTYLLLVGIAHALAYRRESERRALSGAQLETRLVEAQLQALQRQLHPHFLFNTLNTISGLMRSNLAAADLMIEQLGNLLRMTLDTSSAQQVTLQEELDVLQTYLGIEQTRFGGRLAVDVEAEPEVLDAMVPNLLLQPLVENAIRHGIAPNARPGWITVHASREGDELVLQIRDSGDGLPPYRVVALNQGVGLSNTRARLERLYPSAFHFTFANVNDGFCVTVSLPFQIEEPVRVGAA